MYSVSQIVATNGTVQLHVSCALSAVSIAAGHVDVVGGADVRPLYPIRGGTDICRAWPTQLSEVCGADPPPPYAVSIAASTSVSFTRSLAVASLLVCRHSRAVRRLASGGAGHGGAGGNVMPVKEGAGAAFETSGWPQWPGSSAASHEEGEAPFRGGDGGGLLVFAVKAIAIAKDGVVSVRGGNGTRGGGGGSGGTIVLGGVANVAGDGVLDLSGGSGSSVGATSSTDTDVTKTSVESGGGGGGGVMWIHYQAQGSGRDFHGQVVLAGGVSAGQTGLDGVATGDACGSGCGGLLCLPCTPGTFSPAVDVDCTACPIGASICVKCPRGSYSDEKGASGCTLCPNGTIAPVDGSSHCADCGVGETTAGPGAVACRGCSVKPEHATYNKHGSCAYMCDKGHIGLDCLTPFEEFIQPIGGPVGFVVLCFVTVLSVFGMYGYVSSYGNGGGSIPILKQYTAVRAPAPPSPSTHLPRLTDHQLTFHVARLYFDGANTLSQPWQLSTDLVVSPNLRKTMYEGSYAGFASKCNAICTNHAAAWNRVAHVQRLARLVVPPVATWMLRLYQRATVKLLFAFVTEYGTGFFRDLDVQVTGAHLILGYSSDYSLGYVDVLLSPDAVQRTHEAPPPPPSLLFVAAGIGSFMCPYYLDTNDTLLRAVPSRVEILRDSVWLEFIAAMNQHLRLLTPSGSLDAILDHVHAFNDSDVLNGHTVEFGVYTSPRHDAPPPGRHVSFAVSIPDDCFERVFETQSLPPHSKWAIFIVHNERRRRVCHPASSANKTSATSPPPPPPSMPAVSSIRYAALYAPDPSSLLSAHTTPLLEDDSSAASRPSKMRRTSPSVDLSAWRSSVPVLLAPWSHVQVVATPYTWLLPYSLLLLLSVDFFTMLWILIEYFCIQVLDPMAQGTGCSQVAFELLLLCMPGAVLGAPVLGIVFVLQRHSLLGRLVSLTTRFDAVYHAYLGEYVLGLVLAVMAIKYAEAHVGLYVLAQFEGRRMGRGWKGLFTTQEYYDAAYRRF
ncbi:hypothetical protein B5M09_001394 [Aphanomyces astaci]|uniref:Tyrosine-protein kinase ephrin type A/B receptor-like domain-containing protein n=1 Tax=Aphanomyces astaci TaxID=112090 RepID=A0A3R7WF04_APHAT|nr:hypothetical protein B5M09_001394 [Aphanomyces astaci]